MTDLSPDEFDHLVLESLRALPQEIIDIIGENNVAITVQDWPSPAQLRSARVPPGSTLFGLYEGVPLTQRSSFYGMVAPDRITIFRGPLITYRRHPAAIAEQVRKTVIHEIGHFFGMDEAHIRSLGY